MPYSSASTTAPSVAQALAFTQDNRYDKAADRRHDFDRDVQFNDVLKEKYKQEEIKAQKAREAYLEDAANRKENYKIATRESEEKKRILKAEEKQSAAAKDIEDSAELSDRNDAAAADSAQNAKDAVEGNVLDKSVSTESNPLQKTQLPYDIQEILLSVSPSNTNNAEQSSTINVDAQAFDTQSNLENLQFLSVLNSLQIDDVYASDLQAANLNAIDRIESFIDKLVQQYAQNDPSATLSNLTPQQVAHVREHLAQLSNHQSGNDVLGSILALQNIDPDTALSRGGPNGVHAGLDRQDIINNALNTPVLNQISDILASMAQVVKPAPTNGRAIETGQTPTSQQNAALAAPTLPDQQLAARLNNLSANNPAALGTGAGEQSPNLLGLDGEMSDVDFEHLINKFTSENRGYTQAEPTRAQTLSQSNAAAQSATAQNTTGTPPPPALTDFSIGSAPLSVADSILQELGLNGTLVNGSAAQISGLTNIVTNAQNASASHPAAQTIAAQLHKTANGGVNKAITIRLDPPELGRVEIKMSFEANSQIKAVLTVENSETHLMMQRDQQILERALQNAGFDTEGALQFELAQDGHNFDQDGGHDSFHQGQNGEQVPEEEVEVIDTVMNWSENAETGHISYDLLV